MNGKRKGGGMTAAELMEKLSKDKEYQARAAEREKQRLAKEAASLQEQRELSAELARVGVQAQSAWDLVNTRRTYPAAVPVLLDHLRRPYSEKTKEGIARALAVPEARDAWDVLLSEFLQAPDGDLKFAIGCALEVAAGRDTGRVQKVIDLLRDPRHGTSRLALLEVLALSKKPEVRAVLNEFADDPVLGEQSRWYLKHPGRRSR